MDTGRLFVRNLAYDVSEAELSEAFGRHGSLEEVHLVLDRDTKRSRGIAYVKFTLPEDAVAAFHAMDMTPLAGRLMHVLPSKRHPGDEPGAAPPPAGGAAAGDAPGGEGGAAGGFKAQRDAKRKADAGNRAAWNSLFMRTDTVAEAVAAHYGVTKGQLLDREAADLPVRMALGEAQVISQTKAALSEAGVNVPQLEAAAAAAGKAAASKSVARSPTTLLVKNLPYSSEEGELLELFGRAGTVARLVLPPTHTLALVEYAEPQDARSAFKALAYKKYRHVPLYLEWAPRDVWGRPPPAAAPAAAAAAAKPAAAAAAQEQGQQQGGAATAAAAAEEGGDDGDGGGGPTGSIYVKNLNFTTTDAALAKHFDRAASAAGSRVVSARVARRPGPDGKPLSLGFGFVEVEGPEAAKAVSKALQGSTLEKHKLQLQLSKHKPGGGAAGGKGEKRKGGEGKGKEEGGAKLVVRNVAFEATRRDILGLFGPFGHVKSARLPKKFDGSHRGFAFVEFVTKQEARNALEGVGGTHLYGRRLVVEYASAGEEGLDELRAKAGAALRGGDDDEGGGGGGSAKRLKRTL
ncbi:MAG: hypothetical protein J3K34DRAFT_380531 [Monoraphidium minutum]|nr:MAG: hypothetical protein J3K34DRAFT_380531 [Monoraphidium minutum]